jgi:hypothetical protein
MHQEKTNEKGDLLFAPRVDFVYRLPIITHTNLDANPNIHIYLSIDTQISLSTP